MDGINKCPVCGKSELQEYDICDFCGWENDLIQLDDPNYAGGANSLSLNEARKKWKEESK